MKSSPQDSAVIRDESLERKFLEKLVAVGEKIVKKNFTNPMVLPSIQIASLDFLGSIIAANAKMLPDQSARLNYVEHVRDLANCMCDQLKSQIRSVDLH